MFVFHYCSGEVTKTRKLIKDISLSVLNVLVGEEQGTDSHFRWVIFSFADIRQNYFQHHIGHYCRPANCSKSIREENNIYLNLIDVHMLVRFLHIFEAGLHGVNLKHRTCEYKSTQLNCFREKTKVSKHDVRALTVVLVSLRFWIV